RTRAESASASESATAGLPEADGLWHATRARQTRPRAPVARRAVMSATISSVASWECGWRGAAARGRADLADSPGLSAHEVHQDELPEGHRVGEVRLAPTNRGHLLHELHQAAVPGEHERVDQDARAPAQRHLAVGGLEDLGVESHRVDVDAPVGER